MRIWVWTKVFLSFPFRHLLLLLPCWHPMVWGTQELPVLGETYQIGQFTLKLWGLTNVTWSLYLIKDDSKGMTSGAGISDSLMLGRGGTFSVRKCPAEAPSPQRADSEGGDDGTFLQLKGDLFFKGQCPVLHTFLSGVSNDYAAEEIGWEGFY